MEYNNMEVGVLIEAIAECSDNQIRELDELQLALVGGGAGEAAFG